MAGHELVVGLVDVEVDGEFGFGGDDFVGGHGGGDSFLLGEIDLWHAGVLASLPAVCMAPECPGKTAPPYPDTPAPYRPQGMLESLPENMCGSPCKIR